MKNTNTEFEEWKEKMIRELNREWDLALGVKGFEDTWPEEDNEEEI